MCPRTPQHTKLDVNQQSGRPGSAPPVDLSMRNSHTFKKSTNGSINNSNNSLTESEAADKKHTRKGSLAGRLFSALES